MSTIKKNVVNSDLRRFIEKFVSCSKCAYFHLTVMSDEGVNILFLRDDLKKQGKEMKVVNVSKDTILIYLSSKFFDSKGNVHIPLVHDLENFKFTMTDEKGFPLAAKINGLLWNGDSSSILELSKILHQFVRSKNVHHDKGRVMLFKGGKYLQGHAYFASYKWSYTIEVRQRTFVIKSLQL